MQHVIIAAPPVLGELRPLLQIAHHLVMVGHPVTVITGSRFAHDAERIGARFVPLHGAADFDAAHLGSDYPLRATLPPGPPQLDFDMRFFTQAMPVQHRVLQDVLHDRPDSALVANSTFMGAWPAALGAPGARPAEWIAVGCNPIPLGTAQATVFGPVMVGGVPDVAATTSQNTALRQALQPSTKHLNALLAAMGATRAVDGVMDGFVTVAPEFWSLSVRAMDFGRTDLPASVTFAGILLNASPRGMFPAEVVELLQSPRPLIVVTQGTTANDDFSRLISPTLNALADQDVDILAALGPGRTLDHVPANAVAVGWVPFGEVLPRASVYVTNGGFGGTQLALASRVPVVTSGATEDKSLVAARVAAARVGIDLGPDVPSPEAIRTAVTTLSTDTGYRTRVEEVAKHYLSLDPLAALTERLSR